MTFWIVFQVVLNISLIALGLIVWARVSRPQKDDPRLSRGLQLLQSKIAILEDLSDRTDVQVKQLSQLLDQKAKDMDLKLSSADDQLLKVEKSIQKSLEVSKIFQDKIPHKEIIERQNTLKYIQAARLAHQGLSAAEIASKVDVPMSELEFIVKVNKNKLMFSEEHLPQWAQDGINLFENPSDMQSEPVIQPALARSLNLSFENQGMAQSANDSETEKIEKEFKKAIEDSKPEVIVPVMTSPDIPDFSAHVGALEICLEGDLTSSDLRSSIQKAKELLNRTMDKAFDVVNPSQPAVQSEAAVENVEAPSHGKISSRRSRVIKEDSSNSKKIKPYEFKKIDL